MIRSRNALGIVGLMALAACGGGGGTSGGGYTGGSPPVAATPTPSPTPVPAAPTPTPTAVPQQISMAIPSSAMGSVNDPVLGAIGGYTQALYSQTLAFVPGAQIMIKNAQAVAGGIPHTLNVVSQSSFPAAPAISTTASGGTTMSATFASGNVAAQQSIGPITLAAGTYFIGCAYHYASNSMRTVLTVSASATPGPQATPVPASTGTPDPYGGTGY